MYCLALAMVEAPGQANTGQVFCRIAGDLGTVSTSAPHGRTVTLA